jgi:hypothetical protein
MKVGKTFKIKYVLNNAPSGTTITWSSSDPSIVDVDANGKAKANSAGEAVITGQAAGVSASGTITVNPPAAKSITITSSSYTESQLDGGIKIAVGDVVDMSYSVSPTDAKIDSASWHVSNTSVMTFDSDGELIARSSGRATLTVTSGKLKDTLHVTVGSGLSGMIKFLITLAVIVVIIVIILAILISRRRREKQRFARQRRGPGPQGGGRPGGQYAGDDLSKTAAIPQDEIARIHQEGYMQGYIDKSKEAEDRTRVLHEERVTKIYGTGFGAQGTARDESPEPESPFSIDDVK